MKDSKGSLKSAGNCELLPKDFRNLSYGIHILQSSDPVDSQYTMAGINHHIHGIHNRTNLKYWDVKTTRIPNYWDMKLRKNIRTLPEEMRMKLLEINSKLQDRLRPDSLYTEKNKTHGFYYPILLLYLSMDMGLQI